MTIKLGDNRINRVASNEGYISTINPSAFVNAWSGTIQAGQQLQRFGEKASELVIKQKRLADKLSLDDLLNTFDNKQLENEIKLSTFAKKDPTQLIDPNDGKSLLAHEAYHHGMTAQEKLLSSDKFKNLGEDYQNRFRSVTQAKINYSEIKAKFDTTKLLHGLQVRKDEANLNKVLAEGNNPLVSEEQFLKNVADYKAQLKINNEEMLIYTPKQLDAALKNVDKKALKLQYGKATLDATMKGTPEAFETMDKRLQAGEFGEVPPEELPGKRAALYRGFSLSLTAQEARKTKIQKEKEEEAAVNFIQQLESGNHSEDEITILLNALGDGVFKSNSTKFSQLKTDVKQYYKPESESPNSSNKKMELKIANVDLNSLNAEEEYRKLETELATLGLSASDEAARKQQINSLTSKINSKEAKVAASHKKDMKRRIDQKLRQNKSPLVSILGGNLGTIKNVAEDTFEQLILQGDDPKVAWEKIDDILEQTLVGKMAVGFTLNEDELEQELGIDVNDIRRRKSLNPPDVSDEEEKLFGLYLAAKKANAANPLLKKNGEN
jgi:hypothetical protein